MKKSLGLFVVTLAMLASCNNGTTNPVIENPEENVPSFVEETEEVTTSQDSTLLDIDNEFDESEINDAAPKVKRAVSSTIDITAATLNVTSNIDLIFVIENTYEVTDVSSVGVLCWKTPKDNFNDYVYDTGDSDMVQTFAYNSRYTPSTKYENYYCLGDGNMTPYMMSDYVYARAYFYDGSAYHYSSVVKYSVLTYCYNKRNSTTVMGDTTLGAYTRDLLAYGAANQTAHSHNKKRMANNNYYKVKVSGGTLPDGFTTGLYNEGESFTLGNSVWSDGTNTYSSSTIEMSDIKSKMGTLPDLITISKQYDLSYTSDDDEEETCTLNGISNYSGDELVIPSTYDGKTVTAIGESAFADGSYTSVVIPETVTEIGKNAFSDCESMTSVTIGSNVTTIGESAFNCCRNLEEVNIPDSVTTIGANAFDNCNSMTTFTVGKNVTSISPAAFGVCGCLKTITVDPENPIYTSRDADGNEVNAIIRKSADRTSDTLVLGCSTTTIPACVSTLGDYAFYFNGLPSLANASCSDYIYIPSTVTSIGNHCVKTFNSLTVYYEGSEEEFASVIEGANCPFYQDFGFQITFVYNSTNPKISETGLTYVESSGDGTNVSDILNELIEDENLECSVADSEQYREADFDGNLLDTPVSILIDDSIDFLSESQETGDPLVADMLNRFIYECGDDPSNYYFPTADCDGYNVEDLVQLTSMMDFKQANIGYRIIAGEPCGNDGNVLDDGSFIVALNNSEVINEEIDPGSLVIVQIDPTTNEIFFTTAYDVDTETGNFMVEFPCVGPYMITTYNY